MHVASVNRHWGAIGFVAAAVLVTTAIVVAFTDRGDVARPHILGPGAAPGPSTATHARGVTIPNSPLSPQQAADDATGKTLSQTPLSPRAFNRPIALYRAYAGRRQTILASDVRSLTSALRSGDRARARTAWARADSAFARIGAAYGALGSLGDAIDGSPGGLPGGARDPHFTGLQRIEAGLWSGRAPASLAVYGVRLRHDVARLRGMLLRSPIDPLTYATRAHEILEDVQRDRLTRTTPSGSGVRATADGLAATRVVLDTLTPILAGRGDALGRSRFWLDRLARSLSAIRTANGGRYPPVSALTLRERETLDGVLGATLEALSGIPGELEAARPPRAVRIP